MVGRRYMRVYGYDSAEWASVVLVSQAGDLRPALWNIKELELTMMY